MSRFNEYKDYRTAAERHLMTCKYLIECIQLPENIQHKPSAQLFRKKLLNNIYYLSGYTIESIVNFAIYECVNQSSSSHKIKFVNELCVPKHRLIFSKEHFQTKRPLNDTTSYLYVIKYHKFMINYKVLSSLASANPNFDKIPVIGGKTFPTYWTAYLQKMFNTWDAQSRYTEVNFSETQIVEFFNLSSDIYAGIRLHITT